MDKIGPSDIRIWENVVQVVAFPNAIYNSAFLDEYRISQEKSYLSMLSLMARKRANETGTIVTKKQFPINPFVVINVCKDSGVWD